MRRNFSRAPPEDQGGRPIPTTSRHRARLAPADGFSAKVRCAAVTPEPQLVTIGLSRSTPAARKRSSMLLGRQRAAVFDRQRVVGHVDGCPGCGRSADPAAARRVAGKAPGAARIDHLRASRRPPLRDDLRLASRTRRVHRARVNFFGASLRHHRFERRGLRLSISATRRRAAKPSRSRRRGTSTRRAAPSKGRRCHRGRRVAVADAERAGHAREFFRARQHMGQGDRNDRESPSISKNTAPGICPARYSSCAVALLRRQ